MTHKKMILAADVLLTMDADNRVLRSGAVLVEDGVIAAVGTAAELGTANPGVETKVLRNAVHWAHNPAGRYKAIHDAPNVPVDKAPEPIEERGPKLHAPGEAGYR